MRSVYCGLVGVLVPLVLTGCEGTLAGVDTDESVDADGSLHNDDSLDSDLSLDIVQPEGTEIADGVLEDVLELDRGESFDGEGDNGNSKRPVLADYNSELRESKPRGDDQLHVNSPLLVERLIALNANTYAFLIYHNQKDWEDLQEYLPLAEAAGLKTWVYLVPPTERPANYPPYEGDYVAWGRAIGELAKSYPSLEAFAMDDFNGNLTTFTPATTCAMLQAARENSPGIRFYAVDYFRSVTSDFRNNDFRGCIDGVIFPYINLDDNGEFRQQIEQIGNLRIGGLSIAFSYPADMGSAAGDYVRYSLPCAAESPDGKITFSYSDSYSGPTEGYHVAKIRFGDMLLWSEDIAGSEALTSQSVDFKTSNGASLIVELVEEQGVGNYGVKVMFLNVKVEGCGDAAPEKWTAGSNNSNFSKTISIPFAYPQLEIFPMIYATSTSWHPDPPTPEIIEEAVSIALKTWSDGISQGPITYCLNKDPADPDYTKVQALYAEYADGVP